MTTNPSSGTVNGRIRTVAEDIAALRSTVPDRIRSGARDESGHRLLIVDDEASNVQVLERIIRKAGYSEIATTTDSRQVLPLFRSFAPDILLLDLHMPHLDGYAVIRQVSSRIPEAEFFPIIVISGDLSPEAKREALGLGAKDFIAKPFEPIEVLLRIRNLLATRDLNLFLEDKVRERTEGMRIAEIEVANRLALAAELRDYKSGAHVQRVGEVTALIAAALGRDDTEVELLRLAAPLHDIGKIGIPDAILLNPGPLSPEEFEVMKTHTSLGARMLAGSSSRILQLAEEIALYHHENWDGTGYTPGLGGDTIPLAGRIASVADVFDALSHSRPYKKAWPIHETIAWIESQRAKKFDPAIVDTFIRLYRDADLPPIDPDA